MRWRIYFISFPPVFTPQCLLLEMHTTTRSPKTWKEGDWLHIIARIIILKCMSMTLDMRIWLYSFDSGQRTVAGICEYGNEFSGFIRQGVAWLVERLLASLDDICFIMSVLSIVYNEGNEICFDIVNCIILRPGKPGGTEIKWHTSAAGLCWWCESTGR
jgi:hypothetical protein